MLGAAAITPNALIKPARRVSGVAVSAIAARDRARAQRFADRHGIADVLDTYQQVLDSPEIDAVYIPLPNGLHGMWTERAIAAGKHVLCEKPFTANAEEAAQVARTAAASDRVVMEAFHYRYHPLVARVLALIEEGAIGRVQHVEARMCFPLPKFSDIRYNLRLAGGATMDAGCYAIHALRTFGPGEPTVKHARAKLKSPGVDRAMDILLAYPDGTTGRVITSMWSSKLLDISLQVHGDGGSIKVVNFAAPQFYHRLTVRRGAERHSEKVTGPATYTCQLEVFRDAVASGGPVLTDATDAVRTMSIIDDAYRAAGLEPRRPTEP